MKLDILDKYLAIWEQFISHYECYFELMEKYQKSPGIFKKIPDTNIDQSALRAIKALNVRKSLFFGSKLIDYAKNSLSKEYYTHYHEKLGLHGQGKPVTIVRQILDVVPDVASWFLHSKKVYSLSGNFFALMCHTDIKDFFLSDIVFPFDSYLIALPLSVQIMQEQIEISHVLFQKYQLLDEWRIRVVLLGPTLMKKHDQIKVFEKRFSKSFQSNDPTMYLTYLGQWINDLRIPMIDFGVEQNIHLGGLYDLIAKDDKNSADVFLLAFKVALYFMSMDNKTDETIKENKEPAVFSLKNGSIKNILVDLFEIDTSYSISHFSSSSSESKKGASMMDPRFRRGYFRRKPGEGKNPNAAKVVQVRPTIINKHLLSEKSLKISEQKI
ncbi:MAG: hypothetical protein ACK4NC_05720 [Candidatus Gracilibacteria bacterium]